MAKHLFVAVPMMDELENLPQLFNCLKNQTHQDFTVYVCVNQPDSYWTGDEPKLEICENNQNSMDWIKVNFPNCILLDKSSKGKAWPEKALGVGYARRELMEAINTNASDEDIVVSLDADTKFEADYFSKIIEIFNSKIDFSALSVPYYHPLTGNLQSDRAILRYEIYMRYYALNLWRINSPYAFTALGSAMVFSIKNYRKIGGITPKLSGEDFYFLQKMQKYKPLLTYLPTQVYPSSRFSSRVFFGTGPALIKGAAGNWDSYPIYAISLFDEIKEFYEQIPILFEKNVQSYVSDFLTQSDPDLWLKLRLNNKTLKQFTKAVHDKFDGLRILQYLKSAQQFITKTDEECLLEYFNFYCASESIEQKLDTLNFNSSEISLLNQIRNYLCTLELTHQIANFNARS